MSKLTIQILICLLLMTSGLGAPFPALADPQKIDHLSCTYAGKPLFGRVQVVTSSPDIRIATVSSLEDLRVQVVNSLPDHCGKWEFVNSSPNLKVQFVESSPDIKIRFVESFPGLR
jgi:hypothetical protein